MLKVKPRLYQETLFSSALKGNTLIVLPTGLGKTLIAIMVGLARQKDGKILFLSPTKPLVEQHARSIKEMTEMKPTVIHGTRSFEKRKDDWGANWIVATPQTVQRDMLRGVDLGEFSLIIFDEAHRATGDYAYTHIAKQYMEKAGKPLILGLTASPGNSPEKIQEVIDNLFISKIEIRTERDKDVRPYVKEKFLNWTSIHLSREYQQSVARVKNVLREYLRILKGNGHLKSANLSLLRKRDLLKIDAKGDFDSMSALAAAFKSMHAYELLETQGPEAYAKYLEKLRGDKTRAAKELIEKLPPPPDMPHPKIGKMIELLKKHSGPAIVFANFRDQVNHIIEKLRVNGISAERFVGQKEGMTQKKQKEIVEKFRTGEYRVLVSTSVGEEGIDLPSVDLLIFYEPVASGIRHVQRRGRLRKGGKVFVLITTGTKEEGYYYAALAKERKMIKMLKSIKPIQEKKQKTLESFDERYIVVDDRELSIAKRLANPRVQRIEVGDFIISDRVAVERKTADDFASSIIDGRLFEQISQLKDNYEKPVIIVEGEETRRRVHANAIKGALLSITVDWGVPVLFTKDTDETAALLELLSKREWDKGRSPSIQKARAVTLEEIQERLVSALPGINLKLATRLLDVFGTPLDVFNASLYELMNVEGIGEKKAAKIKKVLESRDAIG